MRCRNGLHGGSGTGAFCDCGVVINPFNDAAARERRQRRDLRDFFRYSDLKFLWNQFLPRWRLCYHPWCLRVQTYDYRCWKHQDDP